MLFLFASDIGQVTIFPGAGSYVGLTSDPAKWFTSLIMPWLVLAAGTAAIYARLLRGSLIEMMGEDYIRTARAKGLPERTRRPAPRHALGDQPDRDRARLDIAILLGGAVLVETVFNIPGIGRLNYDAIAHCGLPDRPGNGAVRGDVHHRREHRRRHRLRVPRPAGALLVSAPSGEPLLRVEDLRVEFPTEDGVVHAVDGVTYEVHGGRTLGIVGESGSGKTVSSLTTLGLTRTQGARVSAGGSCSRDATSSRSPKASCARSAATTSR